MNKTLSWALLTFFLSVFMAGKLHATTRAAASCSSSDVQAAIDQSVSGDTVTIPAGTCTWTTGLTVPKNISLVGSGQASTHITDAVVGKQASRCKSQALLSFASVIFHGQSVLP